MSYLRIGITTFLTSLMYLALNLPVYADEATVTTQVQETAPTTTTVAPATTTVTTETTQTPTGQTQVIERRVISSPVPAAKEVIATPQGYIDCFTVEGNWFKDVWVATHRVCQYENTGEGVAWVEGYWACNKATTEGVCTNWEWRSGHWTKTLVVY